MTFSPSYPPLPSTQFGVAPVTEASRFDELVGSLAVGITSGAITAMLLNPPRRGAAFRVLIGALIVDAFLIGSYSLKYGGH